jgi:uncharacterized membrane protein YtjA (UPF0391 family)
LREGGDQNRGCPSTRKKEDTQMLYWALVFFIVAIVAGIFGFGGISAAAGSIAQILFFVFLVLFLVSLLVGLSRRSPLV